MLSAKIEQLPFREQQRIFAVVETMVREAKKPQKNPAGHRLCGIFQSVRSGAQSFSSNMASISTGRLPGSTLTPMAEREGMPISSPKSSPSSAVAPFATAGWL